MSCTTGRPRFCELNPPCTLCVLQNVAIAFSLVLTTHFPIWYQPIDGGRLDLFSPLMVSYSMSEPLLQTIPSLYPLTFESVMLYGGTTGLIVGGVMLALILRSELLGKRPKPIPTPRAKYQRT